LARNKTPYWKCFADDYLSDTNVKLMTFEERGVCHTLWCMAWTNKYKRGHLLKDHKRAITDEEIAKDLLNLTNSVWIKIKKSLLDKSKLKVGRKCQLYVPWMAKYKSNYEKYEKQTRK